MPATAIETLNRQLSQGADQQARRDGGKCCIHELAGTLTAHVQLRPVAPGACQVEFVKHGEAEQLLEEQRIAPAVAGNDCIHLRMADDEDVVHIHLACPESRSTPNEGAQVVPVPKDQLGGVVERILHKLNLYDVLLIPVGKWRKIFDAVAFSLATCEAWQEIDAAATVELNTRDPLVCGLSDFHTINELLGALFANAENPDQGLMLVTTTAPLLIEAIPDGAVRISVASAALADEIIEMFAESGT